MFKRWPPAIDLSPEIADRIGTAFVNDMSPADYVVVDRVDDGVFGVFGREMADPSEEFK